MNGITKRWWVWGLAALVAGVGPGLAEMAKVSLTDKTVLRGDVELTEAEVVIRNAAGQVKYLRERIDHIDWLEPAKTVQSEYMRRFWGLAPQDVKEHFGLAEWLRDQGAQEQLRKQCEYVLKLDPEHEGARALLEKTAGPPGRTAPEEPAGEGDLEQKEDKRQHLRYKGVPPPPLLATPDIRRVKLSELALDGPAERLSVRFRRVRGERDLEDLVRAEMVNAPDYDPDWVETLARGQPYEKLPVVLKATGLKHADRIEIRGDPRAISTYRRRVLPLVLRSCARAGCHGGYTAHVFRLPSGSQTSEAFAYTSFVLLDAMGTSTGRLINRDLPEDSALLHYMLPAVEGRPTHPPVATGQIVPTLRGMRDPLYETLVDWIASLRSLHPDYELAYEFPEWFEALSKRQREPPIPGKQPAQAEPEEKPGDGGPDKRP